MSNKFEGGENMKNLQKQNKVCVMLNVFNSSHSTVNTFLGFNVTKLYYYKNVMKVFLELNKDLNNKLRKMDSELKQVTNLHNESKIKISTADKIHKVSLGSLN